MGVMDSWHMLQIRQWEVTIMLRKNLGSIYLTERMSERRNIYYIDVS